MKTINRFLAFCAVLALMLVGCSKEESATGLDPGSTDDLIQVSFATTLNDLLNDNKAHLLSDLPECSDATPMMASVVVRPEGGAGDGSDDISVDVAIKGDAVSGYFTAYTDDLKLPAGHHTLMSFLVYADEAMTDLIWLAPVDDGPGPGTLSEYVDNPLPMEFDLYDGEKYYLDVEVLCFDERNVNEYGYLFFDLIPNKIYNFCFFANYCADDDRDYPAHYSLELWYGSNIVDLNANTPLVTTTMNTVGYYNNDGSVSQTPTDRPFAQPLCVLIPKPMNGENGAYLTYRLTLEDWAGAYGTVPGDTEPIVGTLSWADILEYLDTNGDDVINDDDTANIDYLHLFFNCDDNPGGGDCTPTEEDTNGDCIPDNQQCVEFPELCPSDCTPSEDDSNGDCIPDDEQCDLFPELCPSDCTPTEEDTNGDCIPDDQQCELFPELCDEGEGNCGTGYMFGDTQINTISNANKWGWAEHWTAGDGATQTLDFWVGAGGNDTSKASKAGTVTITVDGDQVHFEIDLINDYEIGELHVQLSEEQPSSKVAKAPGLYNRNYQVSSSDLDFTLTRTGLEGDDDNEFWVLVHGGDVCNH